MILKEPKTYEEQMQLIQSKGFIIENEQECIVSSYAITMK